MYHLVVSRNTTPMMSPMTRCTAITLREVVCGPPGRCTMRNVYTIEMMIRNANFNRVCMRTPSLLPQDVVKLYCAIFQHNFQLGSR